MRHLILVTDRLALAFDAVERAIGEAFRQPIFHEVRVVLPAAPYRRDELKYLMNYYQTQGWSFTSDTRFLTQPMEIVIRPTHIPVASLAELSPPPFTPPPSSRPL